MFSLAVGGYIGGGVTHAVKVQGRALGDGWALLPHLEFWQEVRGLVEDGVKFTRAEVEKRRSGQGQGSYVAVPDAAGKEKQDDDNDDDARGPKQSSSGGAVEASGTAAAADAGSSSDSSDDLVE